MKKVLLFILMVIVLTGCIKKQSLTLSGDDKVYIGEEITLSSSLDIDLIYISSNPNIATVTDEGVVRGIKKGNVRITARARDDEFIFVSFDIEVLDKASESIKLNNLDKEYLIVGDEALLTYITNPLNSFIELEWNSSDETIAIVTEGLIKAIGPGIVVITVQDKNDPSINDSIEIIVKPELTSIEIVDNFNNEFYVGNEQNLTVNIYPVDAITNISWLSSNDQVVTVDENGKLKAVGLGTAIIKAYDNLNNNIYSEVEIQVIQKEELKIEGPTELYIETNVNYNVISLNSTNDIEVVWTTSNQNLATISEYGELSALRKGTVTITATLKSNPSIYATLDIYIEEFVGGINIIAPKQILEGETVIVSATVIPNVVSQEVTWSVFDSSIATVDEFGNLTGLKAGTTRLIATSLLDPTVSEYIYFTVVSAPQSITISGNNKLVIGESLTIYATVNPNTASQEVIWASSNENIATINNNGYITAHQTGEVIVTATSLINNKISASFVLTVHEFADLGYYQTKVLSIDKSQNNIELLNVPITKYTFDTNVKILENGVLKNGSINDLYLGMTNVYVKINKFSNVIETILIDGEKGFNNIRVGIRNSIGDISKDETLYHDIIKVTITEPTTLQTFDGLETINLKQDDNLIFSVNNGRVVIKRNDITILTTSKRTMLIPVNGNSEMKVTSFLRGYGNPSYQGNLEISLVNNRLLLINDVNLEDYLTKVVPSEMPASYPAEALKAQAIAARTYAYMDIISKATETLGYSVDDSTKSQVYNNQRPDIRSSNAVYATKGLIMMNNGSPIQAYYYSTSSGLTASGHEVWIKTGPINEIPYLIGQNLATDSNNNPIVVDTSSEESMLSFFKLVNFNQPDDFASYHRWKVTFTKEQMKTTLNTNLKLMATNNKESFLTKVGTSWVQKTIPNDIGIVYDVYVGERGTSGVVMSLIIETSTGTYKIINQYNIRFTIRPKDCGALTQYGSKPAYKSSNTNASILFSGFFAIEEVGDSFVFYGGGNGHGVGMSQNGARGLADTGMEYKEILETYYSNIDLVDITYNYSPLNNYKHYLG